jgi:hypothetical protein
MTTNKPIHALWFDRNGCGPDHFKIELQPMKQLKDGGDLVCPATLGLRLRAGELVILGASMIDGGFMLDREQLQKQIDAWLEATEPEDAAAGETG